MAAFKKLVDVKTLGAGIFRKAFKLGSHNLIVKIPMNKYGAEHTRAEIRRIKRLARFKILRPYLPRVHYFDSDAGVVVMEYYPRFEVPGEQVDALGKLTGRLIQEVTGVRCIDIHSENVNARNDREEDITLIDLGY